MEIIIHIPDKVWTDHRPELEKVLDQTNVDLGLIDTRITVTHKA